MIIIEATMDYVLNIEDCHWNTVQSRFDRATLLLEPKYDINDIPEVDVFLPLERGQRFGTVFYVDSALKAEKGV